jgi:hypothetical protein
MALLALVSWALSWDNCSVKYSLAALVMTFCALSCSPVHKHQSGGGAYDSSALGPVLDANGPLPSESYDGARSFEEWRERE